VSVFKWTFFLELREYSGLFREYKNTPPQVLREIDRLAVCLKVHFVSLGLFGLFQFIYFFLGVVYLQD
jgi:hypothetical protein